MNTWWGFQACYGASIILWMSGAVLMLREFFQEYRGRMYDDSRLSSRAGIPDHGPLEVAESVEFQVWAADRSRRIHRALNLFLVGIALQIVLYAAQVYFLPRFEIPFLSSPVPEQSAPDNGEQAP
jgi:hypothetical protein